MAYSKFDKQEAKLEEKRKKHPDEQHQEKYNKEQQLLLIEDQLDFSLRLMEKLSEDLYFNKNKEPIFSFQLIANKTQMINDIKRIRRELMKLQDMLKGV